MRQAGQLYQLAFASGVTSTSALDLGTDGYSNFNLRVPTMATSCDFYFLVSGNDSLYQRMHYPILSGTVSPATMAVGSGISAGWVNIPYINQRYVKIEFSSAVTAVSGTFDICIS